MEAQGVLENLSSRGFSVAAAGDGVYVSPRNRLTEEDIEAIRANKAALLEMLLPKPMLTESGDLHIPFDSHPRYHHWAGGQSLVKTLVELNAPLDTWRRYVAYGFHLLTPKHSEVCKGSAERLDALSYCAECGYFAEVG